MHAHIDAVAAVITVEVLTVMVPQSKEQGYYYSGEQLHDSAMKITTGK